ncbi:hypothetical protein OIE62_38125 [Streptomyces scopuliridis]|uniref:Uncharacterized protein n=1 Tax=Streptomyces scopuliridis TaxID=452529 RepID=A0ACD4ZYW6_9ACTN|nr:hypothetical protein [Streptomyces scopuliridis]WSC03424.1 hypothetical protein OG835_02795 [Streptomyces scopuliridis]WSC11280.1 hypothetical protein OIE62_38125 [Streptomyces scopuliridis]
MSGPLSAAAVCTWAAVAIAINATTVTVAPTAALSPDLRSRAIARSSAPPLSTPRVDTGT